MKKILIVVAWLAMVISCKKDDKVQPKQQPHPKLLSAVKENGKKFLEFEYDADSNLFRINKYNTYSANDDMSFYELLIYENSLLKQITVYDMPGEVPMRKFTYAYNIGGQMTSQKTYFLNAPNSSSPKYTTYYLYNGVGQVVKIEERDGQNKLNEYFTISYHPNGFIKGWGWWNADGKLTGLRVFGPNGIPAPKGLSGLEKLQFNGDFHIYFTALRLVQEFNTESIQRYNYTNGTTTYQDNYLMSAREYDADGFLTNQTIMVNHTIPNNQDEILNVNYEYTAP